MSASFGIAPDLNDNAPVRPLDDFLPTFEFSERHEIEICACREHVDRALRTVALSEIPVAHALLWVRSLGRGDGENARQPFLSQSLRRAVLLDDSRGEGVVMGLTGQFWRLRSHPERDRPRTAEEFLTYERPDVCKAVIDFRIDELGPGQCRLTTETRVHVANADAQRAFRRYWRLIRPFSGLIRILFLRAVRGHARAM